MASILSTRDLYFDPRNGETRDDVKEFCKEDSPGGVFLFQQFCIHNQKTNEPITDYTFSASILVEAIQNCNVSLVTHIARNVNKVAINFRDISGLTPLHHAMDAEGPTEKVMAIAKVLIEAGADINALSTRPSKLTLGSIIPMQPKVPDFENNTKLTKRRHIGNDESGTTPLGQIVQRIVSFPAAASVGQQKLSVLGRFLIDQGASCRTSLLGEIKSNQAEDIQKDDAHGFLRACNARVLKQLESA